jgi:hypothetical protein
MSVSCDAALGCANHTPSVAESSAISKELNALPVTPPGRGVVSVGTVKFCIEFESEAFVD